MKLMLTSSGITNESLANTLKKLVDSEIKIAFIPTVANVEKGDKSWLIKDLVDCKKLGSVGISAGSIVLSKDLDSSSKFLYEEDMSESPKGLGYVDFYVRPHLNSSHFPKVKDEYLKQHTLKLDQDCYALDDDSAIVVVDGKIEIVSEGKWIKYNSK